MTKKIELPRRDCGATREQVSFYFEKQTATLEDTEAGVDCQFCSSIALVGDTFYGIYVQPKFSNYLATVCESCYDLIKRP